MSREPVNFLRGSAAEIPEVMTGVLLVGHGGFEKLEYRNDIPVPKLGPAEVLIRVAAAGTTIQT